MQTAGLYPPRKVKSYFAGTPVTALAQEPRAMEPMRSKRRASPSLRIICVHVGWPAGARPPHKVKSYFVGTPVRAGAASEVPRKERRGRPWPRMRACCARPQSRVRAARPRKSTSSHANAHKAARLNRCAVQADAASG